MLFDLGKILGNEYSASIAKVDKTTLSYILYNVQPLNGRTVTIDFTPHMLK